ncbi:unnamed protein product [Clavelina lepadiformis]|uniref:C2H2-type domain-containing protein n=1 Tax=Clavelina lepadiformis TaxID=159417 RepID=A0ABP0FL07_CLALP
MGPVIGQCSTDTIRSGSDRKTLYNLTWVEKSARDFCEIIENMNPPSGPNHPPVAPYDPRANRDPQNLFSAQHPYVNYQAYPYPTTPTPAFYSGHDASTFQQQQSSNFQQQTSNFQQQPLAIQHQSRNFLRLPPLAPQQQQQPQQPSAKEKAFSNQFSKPTTCEWMIRSQEGSRVCGLIFEDMKAFVHHITCDHVGGPEQSNHTCYWRNCKRHLKAFKAKYKLVNHIRVHTEEKSFQCFRCGKRFSRSENLKIHIKNSHIRKTVSMRISWDFVCKYKGCDRKYSHPSSLRKHDRNHEANDDVSCSDKSLNNFPESTSNTSRASNMATETRQQARITSSPQGSSEASEEFAELQSPQNRVMHSDILDVAPFNDNQEEWLPNDVDIVDEQVTYDPDDANYFNYYPEQAPVKGDDRDGW